MSAKYRTRVIILIISVVVMLVLFFLNIRRASESALPPTPEPTSTIEIVEQEEKNKATPTVISTTDLGSTQSSQSPEGDATQTSEDLLAQTATSQARILSTAEAAMARATQKARAMSNTVNVLYQDGAVSVKDGSYKQIEDFTGSFNKTGYYQMWYGDYSAKYFVFRTNLLWDNAGEEVSYPTAGCGIVFGFQNLETHYRIFLNLDGNLRTHRMLDGEFTILGIDYYGKLNQPAGHANLILAVDQGWISVYVNNQPITRVYDENIKEGELAYAIASGSAVNFGTICEFKDIELWIIE